jgi:hypothetical protein
MKLPWQCTAEDCERPREGRTELCSSHNAVARKELRDDKKPTTSVRPLKKVPVKKVSEKRAAQNGEYMEAHDPWLEEHKLCEACGDPSEEVHHKNGRFGERLTDQTYWMATCKVCHREIHANPEWAREQGYLILRSA